MQVYSAVVPLISAKRLICWTRLQLVIKSNPGRVKFILIALPSASMLEMMTMKMMMMILLLLGREG
jgi:hypothetical protein